MHFFSRAGVPEVREGRDRVAQEVALRRDGAPAPQRHRHREGERAVRKRPSGTKIVSPKTLFISLGFPQTECREIIEQKSSHERNHLNTALHLST